MRIALCIVGLLIAQSVAVAQTRPAAAPAGDARSAEAPEEVIVRGRRIGELRVQVQDAREQAYAIFNEINSNDDFDVECADEPRRGSRMNRRVCAAQFEGRISTAAAKEYIRTLRALCPDVEGLTQRCFTDPGLGSRAAAAARGPTSEAPAQRDRLQAEIERLATTDLRFAQAMLDFYDAAQQYEAARGRRED